MRRIATWHFLECPARTAQGTECICPPRQFLDRDARPVRGPGLNGWARYWAAAARDVFARA